MKYGRFLRILTMTSILSLLLLALTTTPALAVGNFEITPRTGTVGDRINLYGYGFNPATTLRIYFAADAATPGDSLNVDVDTYQRIATVTATDGTFEFYFNVPSALNEGSDDETVTTGPYYIYATLSTSNDIMAVGTFTVESPGMITLDTDNGPVDTKVEIDGEGFDSREYIIVEYDSSEVDIESGDRADTSGNFVATIIIPESIAGDHTITVTGDTSGITASAVFTVEPAITINPESGPAGTTVTVSGTGFGDRTDFRFVDFAGKDIAGSIAGDVRTDRYGSFTFTFTVPTSGAGNYKVEVEDDDRNAAEAEFAVSAAAITIDPASGYAGGQVNVGGTGFKASSPITITFDNTNVTTVNSDASGNFNTSFTVPSRTTGTYKVNASDGINTIEGSFEIGKSTNISPLTSTASPGYVGEDVTIDGKGYNPGANLKVDYDTEQVATTVVSSEGTFLVTFQAPASKGGAHTITVTDVSDGTKSRPLDFFMDSTPPSYPIPLRPEMGAELKKEVLFDWEDVADPSGVTYILQIATRGDFSQGSIKLEETELDISEYTLTTLESLQPIEKDAPYYWHVRAVDGAGNNSEWSGTGTFYIASGFSLSQTTIYTIIGIGAFVFAIFAFWLGRKTSYY